MTSCIADLPCCVCEFSKRNFCQLFSWNLYNNLKLELCLKLKSVMKIRLTDRQFFSVMQLIIRNTKMTTKIIKCLTDIIYFFISAFFICCINAWLTNLIHSLPLWWKSHKHTLNPPIVFAVSMFSLLCTWVCRNQTLQFVSTRTPEHPIFDPKQILLSGSRPCR